ncbi:MAG: acyltransferase [Candidatus Micrarchaeia archaeon]|jgi:acetyltransferase-like isoleucine patch superfamily enzyme
MEKRFNSWKLPKFDKFGMTKWHWLCQHHNKIILGKFCDIGAFTYINARYGVEISEGAQIGSHCSIYSHSTIDNKHGKITIKKNACVGSHSVIMPGVTIGENAIVGAFSFVNKDIPENAIAFGIPIQVKEIKKE